MIKKINKIWDRGISILLISIFVTAFVVSLISDITDIMPFSVTKSLSFIGFAKFLVIWIPLYFVVHMVVSIIKSKLTKKL